MTELQTAISLSVIVPCYNVERYLDKSLQCLERQWGNRTDYEMIFINDASRDGTIGKLNEFRSRHPEHVIVIDKQQNEGVSAARNSGIENARGAWSTFFDPDDVLTEGGYEHLLALTEQGTFDILRFGVEVVAEGKEISSTALTKPLTIDWQGTSVEYLLDNSFGTCWSYLFRRDLLANHRFPPLSICEDTVFNLSILLENKSMARSLGTVYYYMVRPSSATTTINASRLNKHCDDIYKAINILEDFKNGQSEVVQKRLMKHQRIFGTNLLTRLLLSDKPVTDIKQLVAGLRKVALFPLPDGDLMSRLMNAAFGHLWLLPVLRPLYRLYRNR